MTSGAVDELRRSSRARRRIWAAGDYDPLVERLGLGELGACLVERAGVAADMRVLDVATGTGNVAVPAAAAGAEVWGLDLTWEMLAGGRCRACEAGVDVTWVEGDAEALPFADATFDRVLSSLGVMFATDHRRAAEELVRVCRPGGLVAVCNWTPEGVAGLVGRTFASYLGESDGETEPGPLHWGTENHVEEMFANSGLRVELDRVSVPVQLESAESYVRILAQHAGPVVNNKAVLSSRGRWDDLCAEVASLLEPVNETPGAGWRAPQECLFAIVHKP